MPRLLDDEPRRVAVVRLRTGLGDLLCGVPGLRALRARLPEAHVALITYGEMAPVVARQHAFVDELIAFPGWPGIPERPPRSAEVGPWIEAMRERRFDLAIGAYGGRPAAGDVTLALGARRSAGFFTPGAWDPPDLEGWIPWPTHQHEADRHLTLMARLGAPPAGRALEFPVGAEDEEAAAAVRPDGPYVLVHPGATSPSRRWPPERFAAVADGLAAQGLEVAITGVPGEEATAAAVRAAMRGPARDLCGATDLGAFAVIVRDAALLVGNDTGAAHLAAAMGTRSVTVFLAGDPVRWAHDRVVRTAVGCNPCEHVACPIDHRCATRTTVARVLRAAREAVMAVPVPR